MSATNLVRRTRRFISNFNRAARQMTRLTWTQVAELIRDVVDKFQEAFPAVLEIPSKDHPYDPEKDSVLRRVRKLFGE